jgi:hypothetical protein
MADTDRELLELAAKAAGYKVEWAEPLQSFYFPDSGTWPARSQWNPLTSSGDALELEIALKLWAHWSDMKGGVWLVGTFDQKCPTYYVADTDRRRATTRMAAEIGRSMSNG